MTNEQLLERYPFLMPRNIWTDQIIEDADWTLLDHMPDGWRIAFGEQMCEEIREVLLKYDWLHKYRIVQIKEKYGSLRWYDNGAPKEVHDIIMKYEQISQTTCIRCGRPATLMTHSWIMPFCDCVKYDANYNPNDYFPIENWLEETYCE